MRTTENNREYEYCGAVIDGFLMITINIILIPLVIVCLFLFADDVESPAVIVPAVILGLVCVGLMFGYFTQQPNESRVMIFFGSYRGTCRRVGFYWVNPFMSVRRMSLRIRNMDIEPIKVNDKTGNPVMIGMVLVWKVRDTYRAVFDIDAKPQGSAAAADSAQASALQSFVLIQSDAALREVAGHYAYDNENTDGDEITLRGGSDEIVELLEHKLNERLAMAGIEVVEARINYLAYAPEIAAVMLRRQQASAIITAREKIVEGAVSMVKMALNQLREEDVVELDEERKAAMVSNLLVVLCADDPAQPVVNTGTLYN
ncbi:MAG: SPFH domain-containing protein, partial [Duncaniella sp.]|nr:SPFH domain-containing protein [Duncaniella sp.]